MRFAPSGGKIYPLGYIAYRLGCHGLTYTCTCFEMIHVLPCDSVLIDILFHSFLLPASSLSLSLSLPHLSQRSLSFSLPPCLISLHAPFPSSSLSLSHTSLSFPPSLSLSLPHLSPHPLLSACVYVYPPGVHYISRAR